MAQDHSEESGSVAWLIKHGWEVYDTEGERVGDVEDIRNNHLVVSRGFLFTTERYIPVAAIRDVEDSRVYLNVTKQEIEARGWDVEAPPESGLATPAPPTQTAPSGDVTALAGPDTSRPGERATATPPGRTWDDIMPSYQSAWQQGRGTSSKTWADVEPSYRFGYDMAGDPRYRGRVWDQVQPDLGRAWLSRYPSRPWETVAEEVRAAWESATRG